MSNFLGWIKKNKILSLLVIVILFLLLRNSVDNKLYFPALKKAVDYSASRSTGFGVAEDSFSSYNSAPNLNVKDRMVVKESSMSLLVSDVTNTQKLLIKKAEEIGGYMINSNLQNPEEAASASIILRIPVDKLDETLAYFRTLAVKVVSENLQGTDITDQYVDIKARMDTLLKTKKKFEDILDKAVQVQDILTVQRELINLQSQIDSLQGQEDYLKKSTQASKITIYLSTDELSLPYAPTESWRPNVIFKEAVRSLIGAFRQIGTLIIWIIVFSVIWVPLLILFLFIKNRRKISS